MAISICFSQEQCQFVKDRSSKGPKDMVFPKPLKAIGRAGFQFDPANTILYDDTPEKGCLNLPGSTVTPQIYDGDPFDRHLEGSLLLYLKALALYAGLETEFVERHPIQSFSAEEEESLFNFRDRAVVSCTRCC